MVQQITPETQSEIIYPDSDGKPMAENTEHYEWIVKIKENLEILFASNPDVFIAGDLLWYPVEGSVKTRQAPDVMVIFGRPKGRRGSYKQWEENNIAPQMVFEILSLGNRTKEMAQKMLFYQRYGVEEYYVYDPDTIELVGYLKNQEWLEEIEEINNWVSPRLGIRFELTSDNLEIYYPDGRKFLTSLELNQQLEQEQQKYQDLLAKLQAKGIDINTL
ncbi:Uma2 family endonuclease [Anabaena aphanizomenioides LEGE 00250]|jgi:Uma2 family endonuclease|uniref:Uma2 family endonuclease n=1 Tax=Sphaerospermopsis aphanizomenoides LEGE 00250 TaxID=2777972 RepID=A0ABR9VCA9_9CYAN|nr:Uma2 family endonuclease [Sphaerospermopsis aphanizomenoides]MBE9236131.1 Uma2 family endonuclease [Sphaerospermopsis aphanizomenoides LEGE 00250]